MATRLYGIIGWPLLHTFSPDYFNEKFAAAAIDARYEKFPIEQIESFPELIAAHPDLCGLNVTIPHKTAVIAYLNELSEDACAMNAVNCIAVKDGKLKGYNTDWIGFSNSLKPLLKPHHKKALVLGSGGAAKAIVYSLRKLAIEFRIVSRGNEPFALKYKDLDEKLMNEHQLIINTTPLGMPPHEEKAPLIPYHLLSEKHLLYDIVYSKSGLTPFLISGQQYGAAIKDGLEMLHLQAEASWDVWNNV